jgi:hypothetical protein
MPLTRLIYFSENHLTPGRRTTELNKILDVARTLNHRDQITGALLFDDLWFLQVLEGSRDAVSRTYHRIASDNRHDDLVLVEVTPIQTRQFASWAMGFARRRSETAALFRQHDQNGRFDPRSMNAGNLLDLLAGLAAIGLEREAMPQI